jgi:predicted acetyltransferase
MEMAVSVDSVGEISEELLLEVRPGRESDWPAFADRQARTFGAPTSREESEGWKSQIDFANDCVVVEDVTNSADPYFVGATAWKPMSLTVPGHRQMRVAGSGMTLVAPEYRRRGILRKMLDMELDMVTRQGYGAVIGTVSQGGLYDRFGYGPLCYSQLASIGIGGTGMRDPSPACPRVRQLGPAEVAELIPQLFARWQERTTGALARDVGWWQDHIARNVDNPTLDRRLYYLSHPDGYLSYRLQLPSDQPGEIRVEDFCPVTNAAHTELLDTLLGMELFGRFTVTLPTDDPLRFKLSNPHSFAVTGIPDSIWMRILDVEIVLNARAYSIEHLETSLHVFDPIDKSVTPYDLTIKEGEGRCLRGGTAKNAPVTLGLPELAMIYLGAHRPSALASIGRMGGDSEMLDALDRAFASPSAPFCNTKF